MEYMKFLYFGWSTLRVAFQENNSISLQQEKMYSGQDAAIKTLLKSMLSSDNNVRVQAELDFNHALKLDPDAFAFSLIQMALDTNCEIVLRQSALLHIKRIVPMFWSLAFDRFIGPHTINQDVKSSVRSSLLVLIGDPDSKIRSSAAYALVQIAAVDYPDEWPDLLDCLYGTTTNPSSSSYQVIGSLSVLHEIFDDVVNETQFFEGGIASQVLKTCESLLKNQVTDLEIKVETLRLLKTICQYFETADFDVAGREQFSEFVIPEIYKLVESVSKALSETELYSTKLISWDFKYETYNIQNAFMNSYSYLLEQFLSNSYETLLHDIYSQSEVYVPLLSTEFTLEDISKVFTDTDQFYSSQRERREPNPFLTQTLTKEFEFLQTISQLKNINSVEEISKLMDLLLNLSTLSVYNIEEQNTNPNFFVTLESGLNPEITIRDSARDLLGDMDATDNDIFVRLLMEKLKNTELTPVAQVKTEAIVYLLACCFDNDDTIVEEPSFNINEFLEFCFGIIGNDKFLTEDFQFLVARLILMIPKLLFKYIKQCKDIAIPIFNQVCSIIPKLGGPEEFEIIKFSILISFQYYNYFIKAKEFDHLIQSQLINLVMQLESGADEDVNLMLLEVMTIIIAIDSKILSENENTIKLILTIGFKNDSNFALNTSMFECIEDLMSDIPQQNYINIVSSVFPLLLEKIMGFDGTYNPQIDLSLQVLTSFLNNQKSHKLTEEIFNYSFKVINRFLLLCEDDELLQSGSEVLIELMRFSPELCGSYTDLESGESGIAMLLKIISKFLSPGMTDRAIVKLGDLVTLLLEKFDTLIHQYLDDILKALTVRLVKAKEVPTIENMILIFNMLTISQPQATINFLKSFEIENATALEKILPIWFQAYEVMRGYDSILSNVKAFTEIFKLKDPSIKALMVDGDPIPHQVADGVIITRSMAKKMPIQYEKIPADAKIIRLLLDELKNEMSSNASDVGAQHNHGNSHVDVDDEDDEGWEDMENIVGTSFDQLKSYVDDDGDIKRARDGSNDDMKNCLIEFFRQCAREDTNDFGAIYNQFLTDSQKALLSEYLIFT